MTTTTTSTNTDRRAETSPVNGAKSRGPKTESGKKKSASNSLKHGLYSREIVIASESGEERAYLTTWFVEIYAPTTPEEHDLVIYFQRPLAQPLNRPPKAITRTFRRQCCQGRSQMSVTEADHRSRSQKRIPGAHSVRV